ncbi:MAG: hypothetical protein INR62_11255 [Rhodospirillales bacterium]|nr:hypothetical protein [Acetobacter sp.]
MAATALQKAQATQIYAGLGLWPKDVMAGLVAGQLAEDGIYPDAGAAFEAAADGPQPVRDYSPDQPRDPQGRWTEGGGGASSTATHAHPEESWLTTIGRVSSALNPISPAEAAEINPEEEMEKKGTGGPPLPTEEALKPPLLPILGPQLQTLTGSTSLTPVGGAVSPPSSLLTAKRPPAPSPLSARPSIDPTLLARPGYQGAALRPSTSIAIEDLPQSTWTLEQWGLDAAPPGILSPGPFARYCIPAGPSASPSTEQQFFINWLGNQYGCHTCGTRVSGLQSGNWIGDHLPITKLIVPGRQQYYFPQCQTHSRQQGGFVRAMRKTMP